MRQLFITAALLAAIGCLLVGTAQAKRPAHYTGWMCIHNGAYPGAPHEGNSATGTYTGPLQMTNPWMGYSGNWYYMPVVSVFWIAEKVAARYHFAYWFMKGQWPNTYPPCARYFG
jgi:hypothetical protein